MIALLLLGAGFFAPAARAESADALLRRGIELRKAGRDVEAIAVFKELIKIDTSPRSIAQLGLAEQAAGMWIEADEQVGAALRATRDPWIKKNEPTLRRALETIQGRLGRIEVWGDPAGAEVLLDGKVVGILPLADPIRVVAGTVSITVRSAGYIEKTTQLTIGPKKWVRERFDLPRVPARANNPSPGPVVEARTSPPARRTPPPQMRVESRADERGGEHGGERPAEGDAGGPGAARRSLKWVSGGLALAAAGVGVYGYSMQRSAGQEFNRPQSCTNDPVTGAPRAVTPGGNDAHCRDLKSRVDRGFQIEVIALAGAGALLGAGLILWLTEPRRHAGSETAWLCAPATTAGAPASVACTLRF